MPNQPNQIYQIKVTLNNSHPPIWRRIQVSADTTLLELHHILQIVMGWDNYHLHMFTIEGFIYGDPFNYENDDLGIIDEAKIKLKNVIYREGQRFRYEYDFGDSWQHTLLVEKILPPQEGVHYPICLKGKRACPPEDIGGVWGYECFLEALQNPEHENHDEYMTWYGGNFDPEVFDLEEVNQQLRRMSSTRSNKSIHLWTMDDELIDEIYEAGSNWLKTLPEEHQMVAEELALRKDVVTLLSYLRDNKVIGTQSTGNFPLKAIHDICARFVDPPKLEIIIGGKVHGVRSENEVWALFSLHILAVVGGLITGGPSRRWKLTPIGERFLAAPSSLRVWHLLAAWWMFTNWAVTVPYGLDISNMPPGFTKLAIIQLLATPLGESTSFAQFVDQLIESSGMDWESDNQSNAPRILQIVVERTIIDPLVTFGILHTEYEADETLSAPIQRLSSFRITPIGKGLLEAMQGAMTYYLP